MWRVLGLGLGGDRAAPHACSRPRPELAGFRASDVMPWSWLARRLGCPSPESVP